MHREPDTEQAPEALHAGHPPAQGGFRMTYRGENIVYEYTGLNRKQRRAMRGKLLKQRRKDDEALTLES